MACLLVCRRNCGLAEKYNTVLTDCGMPTVRRWLPQALALPSFFCDVSVERGTLVVRCGAVRCVVTEYLCTDGMETTQYHNYV